VANVPSAEKRNRQRLKRRERNLYHLSTMRTFVKKLRKAIDGKDAAGAAEGLKGAVSHLDRAAQKGVITRQTAARKISRLTRAVAKLQA
jgi:small subunit ribosomal protein S20